MATAYLGTHAEGLPAGQRAPHARMRADRALGSSSELSAPQHAHSTTRICLATAATLYRGLDRIY